MKPVAIFAGWLEVLLRLVKGVVAFVCVLEVFEVPGMGKGEAVSG